MITRNIILLPPSDVAEQVIVWSRKIASEYKTDFILDGKQFYPHITLYQAAYPDNNLPNVEKQIAELVKNVKPFRVQAKEFSTLMGFIFFNAVKSKELISLHQHIVSLCNPLREGVIIPSDKRLMTVPNVPAAIKKSIRTYGSALVMNAYIPHITICRLRNPQEAPRVLATLGTVDIAFDVHGLSFANIGPDGTVNEIIKEFPFQMI